MPTDAQLAVELIGRTDYGRMATTRGALPFLAFARHVVADGRVLLRVPDSGHHRARAGSVVAYGADNLGHARPGESLWCAQIVGRCEPVEPTAEERELFGPAPRLVDGEPFVPVHLGIEPQFATVHTLDDGLERQFQHIL
jgi:hypothetical protein